MKIPDEAVKAANKSITAMRKIGEDSIQHPDFMFIEQDEYPYFYEESELCHYHSNGRCDESESVKWEEARAQALEEAARVCERHSGAPYHPAVAWTEEQCQFYVSGQQDASSSIAAAIRALKLHPAQTGGGDADA